MTSAQREAIRKVLFEVLDLDKEGLSTYSIVNDLELGTFLSRAIEILELVPRSWFGEDVLLFQEYYSQTKSQDEIAAYYAYLETLPEIIKREELLFERAKALKWKAEKA